MPKKFIDLQQPLTPEQLREQNRQRILYEYDVDSQDQDDDVQFEQND